MSSYYAVKLVYHKESYVVAIVEENFINTFQSAVNKIIPISIDVQFLALKQSVIAENMGIYLAKKIIEITNIEQPKRNTKYRRIEV